ncbi:MAG: hypothetical protein HY814_14595 [Candidatus Riflebacteria bacterium]|nr:hypothetical protein [Candidatus Riflebacteria bacterium]
MRCWESHVAPLGRMSDGRRLVISMAVDHTELRETEAVRERAARLEAANKELESFSYSVSHDLRAPLRAIDGFSQILVEDCASQLDETGKDYLSRIRNASKRMDTLIEDLLEYSRVSRSDFSEEPVDLTRLSFEIAGDLRAAAPDRSVEVAIPEGMRANGDPQLLRLVLQNLLENAWKFTSKRSAAHITVGALPASAIERTFFVRDDGAGFSPEHAGRLFQMFKRLHATSAFPGTGVGLAIVRRIVERHGGRIWAEGKVDEGATFYFTLPCSRGTKSHGEDDTAGRGQS